MASNIQLAAQAIDDECARIGCDPRTAAFSVVMRLQVSERRLLLFLSEALAREAALSDQVRELLKEA